VTQGLLVNGTLGRVIDFMTALEASNQGIRIGAPEITTAEWQNGKEAMKGGKTALKPRVENTPRPELMRSSQKWPVVEFATKIGPLPMCCTPLSFEVNNADGEVEAKRDQVSLC
jgi:ATP-dependent DNA helicase PIF1